MLISKKKFYLFQQKRGNVGCEDGRVNNEQKYDPIPDRFERAKNFLKNKNNFGIKILLIFSNFQKLPIMHDGAVVNPRGL